MITNRTLLLDRIKNYLGNGGLFNPEMMEHDKVRELIIDCYHYIEKSGPTSDASPVTDNPQEDAFYEKIEKKL